MYAVVPKPNKEFCTKVAKQLTEKYAFMCDAGTKICNCYLLHNCSVISCRDRGRKKLIERVHNVAKPGRKRQLEMSDTPAPPLKRGRPKKDSLLERYPSLNPPDAASSSCTESEGFG